MRIRVLAACLAVALTGCKPDLPVDPGTPEGVRFLEISGAWSYSATDVKLVGSASPGPCEITGVKLTLTQVTNAGAFSGHSTGGEMKCAGSLAFLSGPLVDYPIGNGYTFNEFVAFDLGTPAWRHDGLVTTMDSIDIDTMRGTFTLVNGGIAFEGRFSAVRAP